MRRSLALLSAFGGRARIRVSKTASHVDADEDSSSVAALYNLLLTLFDENELRRFIAFGPYGDVIATGLPGEGSAMDEMAFEAVALLRRHGAITLGFFERLVASRPLRRYEIECVARMWFVGAAR